MNKRKIFGIGAAVLMLLVSTTSIVGGVQVKNISNNIDSELFENANVIENNINIEEEYLDKFDKNESFFSKTYLDPEPLDPGNNGITRYQKRLGWIYTFKEYKKDVIFSGLKLPLFILVFFGVPAGAVTAIVALLAYLMEGGLAPIQMILLAAAAAAAILKFIENLENQYIRQKIQNFLDAVQALLLWLDEQQDYKENMIVQGWINNCKINEVISVYCRGETEVYDSGVNKRVFYKFEVPCCWGNESCEDMHECHIEINGDKHSNTLTSRIGDKWCYSDGTLINNFRFGII